MLDQERTKEIETMWLDDLERFESAISLHSSQAMNRSSIAVSEGLARALEGEESGIKDIEDGEKNAEAKKMN